jgi:drug/metabolite transporter (DMT)-like permease
MEYWIQLALIVTLMNITWFILVKNFAKTEDNIIITCYLSIFSAFLAIIVLIYKYYENKISIIPVNITGMFILSILHFTTYIALVKAIDYSDNPGYVRAFVGLEISILAIFYAIYFKEYMSIYKMIGIVSIAFGIVLISCFS